MRLMLTAMLAGIAGILVSATPSHAAPGPILAATPANADEMIQQVQLFPRRYYRQYGYPPGAVVVPAVPVPAVPVVPAPAPGAVVEGAPAVVMVPARPASCGEYRYWNGVACVDARYNNPYVGPR